MFRKFWKLVPRQISSNRDFKGKSRAEPSILAGPSNSTPSGGDHETDRLLTHSSADLEEQQPSNRSPTLDGILPSSEIPLPQDSLPLRLEGASTFPPAVDEIGPSNSQSKPENILSHPHHQPDDLERQPHSSSTFPSTPALDSNSRRWLVIKISLCWFASLTFGLALILFALVHLWVGKTVSEQLHSGVSIQDEVKRGLVINSKPRAVCLHRVDGNLITLSVEINLGVDARRVLGWEHKDERNATLKEQLEARVARWFVSESSRASVRFEQPIQVYPLSYSPAEVAPDRVEDMIQVRIQPFQVPLWYADGNATVVPDVTVKLDIAVEILSSEALARTLEQTWDAQSASLGFIVQDVRVELDVHQFPSILRGLISRHSQYSVQRIQSEIDFDLPKLPPIFENPLQTVRIDSYSFYSLVSAGYQKASLLGIRAQASIANFLPELGRFVQSLDLGMDIPWRFPLAIYLISPNVTAATGPVKMARVDSLPFHLSQNSSRISLAVEGTLLQPSSTATISGPLSTFLDRYLKGLVNDISLRYEPPDYDGPPSSFRSRAQVPLTKLPTKTPPSFLTSLLSKLDIQLPFPGASDTHLLRNLTLKNMRFSLWKTTMLCSGTIYASLSLPREMGGLTDMLNISQILPDVLVYDGDLPPAEAESEYPANAFARLVTPGYINSTLQQSQSGQLILSAEINEVPLKVLDGRSDVFRKYAAKWLFNRGKEGLKTSVMGTADGKADIKGFGDIELSGLPVQGTFFVGGSK